MAVDMFDVVEFPAGPAAFAGDNLGVARHCADTGRPRSDEAHSILDHCVRKSGLQAASPPLVDGAA
eukprot:5542487-Lingulodinium_polyedra.AAC.1